MQKSTVNFDLCCCSNSLPKWRLSKVLSIRRQQVRIKQVMAPFVLIIMSSLVVLTVWTIVDPVVWERKPLSGTVGVFGATCFPAFTHCSLTHGVQSALRMNQGWTMKARKTPMSLSKLTAGAPVKNTASYLSFRRSPFSLQL